MRAIQNRPSAVIFLASITNHRCSLLEWEAKLSCTIISENSDLLHVNQRVILLEQTLFSKYQGASVKDGSGLLAWTHGTKRRGTGKDRASG